MNKSRKIFFVMAGGGHETDRHYYDTIKNRRSVDEFGKYLKTSEINKLTTYTHGRPCAIWGAVPGPSNIRNWETMEKGDYIMVYREGKIILVAEIAMKVRNIDLAEYFWKKDDDGRTWEYIYFMINDTKINVSMSDLNTYLGYQTNYHPQGFMAIKQDKTDRLLNTYGDLVSLLQKLETGNTLEEIDTTKKKVFQDFLEEKIKRAPTEHDEMQWRLISLGNKASLDVWVPINDQGKQYNGNKFKEHTIKKFQEALDVPIYVKNIDTVWKLGLSIKAAFEIEHSTSIYSGILRLSDLRALAPNSNYPLFIVANRNKKSRVFNQLRRPTFANDYMNLDKVIKFLSYDSIRELDESQKDIKYDIDWILDKANTVSAHN